MNIGTLASELTEIDEEIKQLEAVKTDADLQILALRKRHAETHQEFRKAAYSVGDLIFYEGQHVRIKKGYKDWETAQYGGVELDRGRQEGQTLVVYEDVERGSVPQYLAVSSILGNGSLQYLGGIPPHLVEPIE